jgi:ArsR family transcriptional regulator
MDEEQFHRIAKAVADPRRLDILERIAQCDEAACADLVTEFPVSQATMSHHMKELTGAGLVRVRREAKFSFYEFQRTVWDAYIAELNRRPHGGVRKQKQTT